MIEVLKVAGPLVGGVVTAMLAYFLGTNRTRYERRDERRDFAIADIFGAMMRHYRRCIHWAGAGRDPEWEDRVRKSYEDFLDCYYTRSIWLPEASRKAVDAYAQASRAFLIKVSYEMGSAGLLADGTKAMDLLDATLNPPLSKAEETLRTQMSLRQGINSPWQLLFADHHPFVYHG
jgi:hypothetical protein